MKSGAGFTPVEVRVPQPHEFLVLDLNALHHTIRVARQQPESRLFQIWRGHAALAVVFRRRGDAEDVLVLEMFLAFLE